MSYKKNQSLNGEAISTSNTSAYETSNSTIQSLDLTQIKQSSVHDGLLNSIILLRQAQECIYNLLNENEVNNYPKGTRKIEDVCEALNSFQDDLSEVMGVVFRDRADKEIDRQLGKR